MSTRTVCRHLHNNGYGYFQSRKKGLVTAKDKTIRLAFAKRHLKSPLTFWTDEIAFYFDGVSFAHKTNPAGEARSSKTMQWRKPNEGLLTAQDRENRVKFYRRVKNLKCADFWKKYISIYIDGVGFAFVTYSQLDENIFPTRKSFGTMLHREIDRGESILRTTKRKKEGTGGHTATFFVAISHGFGVVL